MEIDPSESQAQSAKLKAEALHGLATGPLSSSIAKLSGSSRGIPCDKDFHFYNNFNEFKVPVKGIADTSQLMLGAIGSSAHLWGKEMSFPQDFDDAYDWLVNVNDEVLERVDMSLDEFASLRKKEEANGVRMMNSVDSEDGFQLVYGKKKKKGASQFGERNGREDLTPASAVKVASRDKKTMGTKQRVPFHIPSIPRPQDEFKIMVNNSNQPFQHVWLQRSEDGSRFIHPQEKFSVLDFVDKSVGDVELVKPPPIESTPFKLVEEVKDLKELAAKLRGVNEFAVDLEHNQYRSFQGLTCLMQISTRTEDFVVDTLKLRIHIGPYLREVFKDPTKKKVMHGADRDILWLQRDFGIYICNLFDTGQASRVLKLERNSLEYLLQHFCGVTANKEYQNADWRLRPLPDEMLRYAREDTHYLLHIYDLCRIKLLSTPAEPEKSDDLLLEVHKRSYDLCMQLYEKELLTESSYLYIYGLQGADLNAQQLAVAAGLCEWRDAMARAEDESTGFILPNKMLLEIAKQMPVTTSKLRFLVKSKHSYVERNLGSVVSIIRHSMQNSAAFEAAAVRLKEGRMDMVCEENAVPTEGNESIPSETPMKSETATVTEDMGGDLPMYGRKYVHPVSAVYHKESSGVRRDISEISRKEVGAASECTSQNGNIKCQTDSIVPEVAGEKLIVPVQINETGNNLNSSNSGAGVTVQMLKKPSRGFGALLGNLATKRKFDPDKKEKEEIKLEQIKSSVNLPFHSFVGSEQLHTVAEAPAAKISESIMYHEETSTQVATPNLGDVISLEPDVNADEFTDERLQHREDKTAEQALEMDEDETVSLSDLSSSFQKCFQPTSQASKPNQEEKHRESSSGFLQVKPFDYGAARGQIRFGEEAETLLGEGKDGDSRVVVNAVGRKKSGVVGQSHKKDDGGRDFPQARRRQAFPTTGNRSATFR